MPHREEPILNPSAALDEEPRDLTGDTPQEPDRDGDLEEEFMDDLVDDLEGADEDGDDLEEDFELTEDREADGVRGMGAQFGPLGQNGSCPACDHARTTSWWGDIRPARSHCRDCHRYWASLREAHCAGCHRHFAYTRAFDEHFRDGECHDPHTLTRQDGQPRFSVREGRFGETFKLAYYGPLPQHWSTQR